MDNIRQKLDLLFTKAISIHKKEKDFSLESLNLIWQLSLLNPSVNLGFFSMEKYAQALGLTTDQYYNRLHAGRALNYFPELREMFINGEVTISTLAMIDSKITCANKDILLVFAKNRSKRELAAFLNQLQPDGTILEKEALIEVNLKLTKEEFEVLNRALDVLSTNGQQKKISQVIVQGLKDLLDKRDPMIKSKRYQERKNRKANKQQSSDPQHDGISVNNDQQEVDELKLVFGIGNSSENEDQVVPVLVKEQVVEVNERLVEIHSRTIPSEIKHQLWLRDHGQCQFVFPDGKLCASENQLEIDHIKMHCHGGSNELFNLQLLCWQHNQIMAKINLQVDSLEPFYHQLKKNPY